MFEVREVGEPSESCCHPWEASVSPFSSLQEMRKCEPKRTDKTYQEGGMATSRIPDNSSPSQAPPVSDGPDQILD